MSHPRRYDPEDPYLTQLRELCLALPEAKEKVSHGHPNFYTVKVFAVFGGVVKGDHASDRYGRSVLVLLDAAERAAALADPRFFTPAYYGPAGWVGLDLTAAAPDWTEVAELLESSYRATATRRLVRLLEH